MKNIDNIYRIQCGSDHVIGSDIMNNYYCFGNNSYKECLIPKLEIILSPTKINIQYIMKTIDWYKDIIDIIPGSNETLILQAL